MCTFRILDLYLTCPASHACCGSDTHTLRALNLRYYEGNKHPSVSCFPSHSRQRAHIFRHLGQTFSGQSSRRGSNEFERWLHACGQKRQYLITHARPPFTGERSRTLQPVLAHLTNGCGSNGVRQVEAAEELFSGHIQLPRQHLRNMARSHRGHVVVEFAAGGWREKRPSRCPSKRP